MIRLDGDRMFVSGGLTLASVAAALPEGNAAIGQGVRIVDLGEVGELDSSALALLLAWSREAKKNASTLSFANLPKGLLAIASLYGVDELLPASQPSGSPAPATPFHH